jgi:hypothetical protein
VRGLGRTEFPRWSSGEISGPRANFADEVQIGNADEAESPRAAEGDLAACGEAVKVVVLNAAADSHRGEPECQKVWLRVHDMLPVRVTRKVHHAYPADGTGSFR